MALHNIECPHCFTAYTISDQQLRITDGVVRCGTCREEFQAQIVKEKADKPKFNPGNAFIEPLTKDMPRPPQVEMDEHELDAAFDLLSTHDYNADLKPRSNLSEHLESKRIDSIDEEALAAAITANLNARDQQQGQLDLKLPQSDTTDAERRAPEFKTGREKELIDEVDKLVDQKLVAKPNIEKSNKTPSTQEPEFTLDRRSNKRRKRGFLSYLASFLTFLLSLLLLGVLIYQLWFKQLIAMPSDAAWYKAIEGRVSPVLVNAEEALQAYDINLPVQRNLSKMELLSAQIEAHPNRASTILLKVSLINRASISQPLPWMEMSLTDANGRLLSRRNLSPKDYIYNNSTSSRIGPNELKKITIELLSFPKSATGYELKLLNK